MTRQGARLFFFLHLTGPIVHGVHRIRQGDLDRMIPSERSSATVRLPYVPGLNASPALTAGDIPQRTPAPSVAVCAGAAGGRPRSAAHHGGRGHHLVPHGRSAVRPDRLCRTARVPADLLLAGHEAKPTTHGRGIPETAVGSAPQAVVVLVRRVRGVPSGQGGPRDGRQFPRADALDGDLPCRHVYSPVVPALRLCLGAVHPCAQPADAEGQ